MKSVTTQQMLPEILELFDRAGGKKGIFFCGAFLVLGFRVTAHGGLGFRVIGCFRV